MNEPRFPPPAKPIGTVRHFKGQRYRLVAVRAHTCRGGRQTQLAEWRSDCAQCGAAFTFLMPLRRKRFEPNRRCAAHKQPGSRV